MEDFSFYFALGFQHIISTEAWDHILFIIVLSAIYSLNDWRRVLILVTAFTVGHSLTLALSVLDVIRFPDKWVEFLIPCTIVITAIINLFGSGFRPGTARVKYVLALLFGFIHGMGFANSIRFILAKDQHLAVGLFAFNAGLEAGQIIIVMLLLVISFIFVQRLKVLRTHWIIFLSAAVLIIAFKMAVERFPG